MVSFFDQCKQKDEDKKLEGENYIFLYRIEKDEETFKRVIEKGISNSAHRGEPIPEDESMADKSYDIFFHPLRNNEKIYDLPYSSLHDPSKVYFVAIAVPLDSNLQVNNRLYSFGIKPLHKIPLNEYIVMPKYGQEGLPEVRIKIDNIPPEYIIISGTVTNHRKKERVKTLTISEENLRFESESYQFGKR